MKAKRPGSHGQPFGAATALLYLLRQDFGSGPLSQLSSAVSSANFPDCRPLWHLMMQAIALAAALPTAGSHFVVALSAGRTPVSSTPHGVVPGPEILGLLPTINPLTVSHRFARR